MFMDYGMIFLGSIVLVVFILIIVVLIRLLKKL